MILCKYSENSLYKLERRDFMEMSNLPLTRRHPRLTKFVDIFFHIKGMSITSLAVMVIVGILIFSLTDYSLLGKLTATIVVFAFLLYLGLIPFFLFLCLFRADE